MSTATIAAPKTTTPSPTLTGYQTHRWTVAEFEKMISTGIIREGSGEFLWGGEIFDSMSEDESHANAYGALLACLFERLNKAEWTIRANNPMGLREGYLPNPDIVVLPGPRLDYKGRRPTAADASLVVEIANTSYADDTRVMLPEYARAGVVQYWIIHINARRVEVYRNPRMIGEIGTYDPPVIYAVGTDIPIVLATPGRPDRQYPAIPVAEILADSPEEES